MKTTLILLLFISFSALAQSYPREWFKEVPRSEAESWEILPQDALPGEVILSKRTELGIFSNFAPTPIVLEGIAFASIEGLWQSLKYPDPAVKEDPRLDMEGWNYTRAEVASMTASEAKRAGNEANKIYARYRFKKVSWREHFFDYKDFSTGSDFHHQLIKSALRAKLNQTEGLWDLLLKTGCLKLRPDHKISSNDPPAYHHYLIFMELRREKQSVPCAPQPPVLN